MRDERWEMRDERWEMRDEIRDKKRKGGGKRRKFSFLFVSIDAYRFWCLQVPKKIPVRLSGETDADSEFNGLNGTGNNRDI